MTSAIGLEQRMSLRRSSFASRALAVCVEHGILITMAIMIVFPFVWMVLAAIKDPAEIFSDPFSFDTSNLHVVENFKTAFQSSPLAMFMLNSLIVVIGILAVQLVTSIGAAYPLAKMEFRGKKILFFLVLLSLCIPNHVISLPLYFAVAKLDLLNTYLSLMFPWFFSSFAIFLFRQHFRTFPQEIINAARIDGFTEVEIILRLMIPSALPAIIAFSVFSITTHWNDLYWPLIVVNIPEKMTAPVGMLNFDNDGSLDYGPLMAAATAITMPLVALFILAQRYFVQGVTMTGFK